MPRLAHHTMRNSGTAPLPPASTGFSNGKAFWPPEQVAGVDQSLHQPIQQCAWRLAPTAAGGPVLLGPGCEREEVAVPVAGLGDAVGDQKHRLARFQQDAADPCRPCPGEFGQAERRVLLLGQTTHPARAEDKGSFMAEVDDVDVPLVGDEGDHHRPNGSATAMTSPMIAHASYMRFVLPAPPGRVAIGRAPPVRITAWLRRGHSSLCCGPGHSEVRCTCCGRPCSCRVWFMPTASVSRAPPITSPTAGPPRRPLHVTDPPIPPALPGAQPSFSTRRTRRMTENALRIRVRNACRYSPSRALPLKRPARAPWAKSPSAVRCHATPLRPSAERPVLSCRVRERQASCGSRTQGLSSR